MTGKTGPAGTKTALTLASALAVCVFALYFPSTGFDFITLDDGAYVLQNPMVKDGITAEGVKRAFSAPYQLSWIPLTWLSLMADSAVFGLKPGGFHFTNVLLHLLNSLLLFAFLLLATGSPAKSFLASLLWAVHPQRVESVAWIAERKDLLSGFFFTLCIASYCEYSRNNRIGWYAASLALMVLGAMAKPVLVVVPLVLLAIDIWPLERKGAKPRLFYEKIPFFMVSGVFSLLTISAQGAARYRRGSSIPERLADVATSYPRYLGDTLCPANLHIEDSASTNRLEGFYALAAVALLLSITVFFFRYRKKSKAAFSGWLWFLAALLPVSGVVPLGRFFVADHFTYLPHMGLSFAAVWGIGALAASPSGAKKLFVAALALAIVFGAASRDYLFRWKDSLTLFEYQARVSPSGLSYGLLANAYAEKKDYEKALEAYEKSVGLNPGNAAVRYEFALTALEAGNSELAARELSEIARIDPGNRVAGGVLASLEGDYEKAVGLLSEEAARKPEDPDIARELGIALSLSGNHVEAVRYFERALVYGPEDAGDNLNMALALYGAGQDTRAMEYLEKTLRQNPANPKAHHLYGLLLEKTGKLEDAASHFRETLRLQPENREAAMALERVKGR